MGIAEIVFHLADATSAMNKNLFKTSVTRSVRIRKAKMPLAENSGTIPMLLQKVRKGDFVLMQN